MSAKYAYVVKFEDGRFYGHHQESAMHLHQARMYKSKSQAETMIEHRRFYDYEILKIRLEIES